MKTIKKNHNYFWDDHIGMYDFHWDDKKDQGAEGFILIFSRILAVSPPESLMSLEKVDEESSYGWLRFLS